MIYFVFVQQYDNDNQFFFMRKGEAFDAQEQNSGYDYNAVHNSV